MCCRYSDWFLKQRPSACDAALVAYRCLGKKGVRVWQKKKMLFNHERKKINKKCMNNSRMDKSLLYKITWIPRPWAHHLEIHWNTWNGWVLWVSMILLSALTMGKQWKKHKKFYFIDWIIFVARKISSRILWTWTQVIKDELMMMRMIVNFGLSRTQSEPSLFKKLHFVSKFSKKKTKNTYYSIEKFSSTWNMS